MAGEQAGEESITQILKKAHDSRKTAEIAAKDLLTRLDGSCGAVFAVSGCSVQPWESLSSNSHTRWIHSFFPIFFCSKSLIYIQKVFQFCGQFLLFLIYSTCTESIPNYFYFFCQLNLFHLIYILEVPPEILGNTLIKSNTFACSQFSDAG